MEPSRQQLDSKKPWVIFGCVLLLVIGIISLWGGLNGVGVETRAGERLSENRSGEEATSPDTLEGEAEIAFDGSGLGDTFTYLGKTITNLKLLEKVGYVCIGLDAEQLSDGDQVGVVGGERYQRPSKVLRGELVGLSAEIYDCMLACFPGEGSVLNSNLLGAGGPCFNSQLAKTSSKWGKTIWQEAVDAFIHDHPEVGDLCHGGAHIAGKNEVVLHGGEPIETLRNFSRLCNSGFQHGTLDALSVTKPSIAEMRAIASACKELTSDLAGECIHGIGHAAYDVTRTLEEASSICEVYDEEGYKGCSYGIVMRRFWREIPWSDSEDVPELIADAEQLCRRWPRRTLPDGGSTLNGCWYAVPYQMWFPIQGGVLGIITMDDLGGYVAEISAACGRAPEVGLGAVCESEAGRYAANAARWVQADAVKVCSYTRDVDGCVKSTTKAVEATLQQRGISE